MIDRQGYDIPGYLFDDAYNDVMDLHKLILIVTVLMVIPFLFNVITNRSKTVKVFFSALIIASVGISTGLYFGIEKETTPRMDVTAQQGLVDHINSTRDFEIIPPSPPVLSADAIWSWEIDKPGSSGEITVVKDIDVHKCLLIILHDRQYAIQCKNEVRTDAPLENLLP